MNKRLRPLNDQIVLKPIDEEQTGNIIIPDTGQEKPVLALVVNIGVGIYNFHKGEWVPHQVKVGDIVVLPKIGVQVVSLNREEYYICQANQLLAVIEEE